MVHEYVSRLRGVLGDASVIVTRAPGYTVQRDACDLDAARFAELLRTARSAVAAELDEALKAFDEALGLWRGDALADVALEGEARSAAAKLDDERRAARAERVDVALALGRHNELIPDLEREIAAEPLDEQVLGQLMLALYRNGRQADALARYRDGRQTLVEDFGIEPGAELRALEQAILRHDPALAPPLTSETFAENGGASADSPPRAPRRRTGLGGGGGRRPHRRGGNDCRCRREKGPAHGRAHSRRRDRGGRRCTRAPCRLGACHRAARRDRLRRRLGLGLLSRFPVGRADLARIAAGRRLDPARRSRAEPCGCRLRAVGRWLRTDRPLPDAGADQPDLRQRLARAAAARRRDGRYRLAQRARENPPGRAAHRALDAGRRAQRAHARATGPQRCPVCGRPRVRELVACLPRGQPGRPRRFLGSDHADPGRAGTFRDRSREARRLGRERARRHRQVDRPGYRLGDHDDPGREHPDRDRDRRRQRLGGKRRGRHARPDRRAQQQGHREGRDRRQPAGVGGRRRQGLGERPDTGACPAERGNRRRGRPLVCDLARPCGQVRHREPGRVRDLRVAAQLPRRAGRRRSAPRSRRRPRPPDREQGRPLVHVHDPARHALLTAVEPAGHRADLQAHDRAQPSTRV